VLCAAYSPRLQPSKLFVQWVAGSISANYFPLPHPFRNVSFEIFGVHWLFLIVLFLYLFWHAFALGASRDSWFLKVSTSIHLATFPTARASTVQIPIHCSRNLADPSSLCPRASVLMASRQTYKLPIIHPETSKKKLSNEAVQPHIRTQEISLRNITFWFNFAARMQPQMTWTHWVRTSNLRA
jgi:hypothetical protein